MCTKLELLFDDTHVAFIVYDITFRGPEERIGAPTVDDIDFSWTAVTEAVQATISEFGLYDLIRFRLAKAIIAGIGFCRQVEKENYASSCFEAATHLERKL